MLGFKNAMERGISLRSKAVARANNVRPRFRGFASP